MHRNRIQSSSSIATEIVIFFRSIGRLEVRVAGCSRNQREKRRFPELQGMKPRGKSPWSPVSHQPHDDAHPASSVTSTRESGATPSGFPFCFLSLLRPRLDPPKPFTANGRLLVPQRHHRIHPHGTPRRQVRGNEGDYH